MKRGVILILFVFVILFSVNVINVRAQEADDSNFGAMKELDIQLQKQNMSLLEKDIEVPEDLQLVARVVFGLKTNEEITLSEFVVMVVIWFLIFSVVTNLLRGIYFMSEGVTRWLGGVVITCLIAVSGVVKSASVIIFNFFDMFTFFAKLGFLKLIFALIIVGAIIYIVNVFINKQYSKSKLEEHYVRGMKAGVGSRLREKEADELLGRTRRH